MPNVFLFDNDDQVVAMSSAEFPDEDLLQRLIATCPELLSGDLITPDDPRRWLLVAREVGIPAEEGGGDNFSVDHLLVDQDGVPALVEVKRATDTRCRREVVAQMLDYAANAANYLSIEAMRRHMARFYGTDDAGVDSMVGKFLQNPQAVESFWQSVKSNLSAARMRLIFVADVVPEGLLRIVEFLNAHTDPLEILAVEIRQYTDAAGRRILVPRVLGRTIESVDRKGGRRQRQWDESSFRAALTGEKYEETANRVLDCLLAWARTHDYVVWFGLGRQYGSVQVGTYVGNTPYVPFTMYTSGYLEIEFLYLARRPPFDDIAKRKELAQLLCSIEGVSIGTDEDTITNRLPSIPVDVFADDSRIAGLMKVLDWFAETIRNVRPQP